MMKSTVVLSRNTRVKSGNTVAITFGDFVP